LDVLCVTSCPSWSTKSSSLTWDSQVLAFFSAPSVVKFLAVATPLTETTPRHVK
jgi:hypothetical protein